MDALVVLIGAAGSGKSCWASEHFSPTQIVSSDACRALVCDDMTEQAHNGAAFRVFHTIITERLALGKLTVADATNVTAHARATLRELARVHGRPLVGIVMNNPIEVSVAQNAGRTRIVPTHVIYRHYKALADCDPRNETWDALFHEGTGPADPRELLAQGVLPGVDVIGDIHGCANELIELLDRLGYRAPNWEHPEGRVLAFVGDYVDRGPDSIGVLTLIAAILAKASAASPHVALIGNHDDKLRRALLGNKVRASADLVETMRQVTEAGAQDWVRAMLEHLPVKATLATQPRLTVVHASLPFPLRYASAKDARQNCLYGEVTGLDLETNRPRRGNKWTESWWQTGEFCVYGHTVVGTPDRRFDTMNIDTGCVFGGKLTALRFPEMELISVPAARAYAGDERIASILAGAVAA